MDQLKRKRRPLRSAATKVVNDVDTELAKDVPDLLELQVKLEALELTEAGLQEIDDRFMNLLVDSDCPETDLDDELSTVNEYREKIIRTRMKINKKLELSNRRSPSPASSVARSLTTKKTYKLPKIEIKKFGGNLTEWLGFWSQFQKVHEDEELHDSDKFQYLVQSLVTGTRARELVESYPQTPDNYPKVIAALIERFGKKKLLMQVYVRELLKMVINNNSAREKVSVCKMYDRLESHLRALESLGVSTEQTAVFLYPMVESSLPEDILIAWQRNPLNGLDGSKEIPPKTELAFLMQFLRQEVENEDQRTLVQAGFAAPSKEKKHHNQGSEFKAKTREEIPTASGLFSGEKSKCIFCEGGHESRECIKAQGMGFEEKRNRIKSKKCCFVCLRPGHMSKSCKALAKCVICTKKHPAVMCPDLPAHKEDVGKSTKSTQAQTSHSTLACSDMVILKTLMVTVVGPNGKDKVRALIDDGSQRSYILRSVVEKLGLEPCGEEELVHGLFGGVETGVRRHFNYNVKIQNVIGRGFSNLTALDEIKICGDIPRLSCGSWMKTLKRQRIWISDMKSGDCQEIGILIGADVIGKMLTGKLIQLENGLTAVETILGWTLMGKSVDQRSVAMTVTSLTVIKASLEQLWDLDTIGITDSAESKSKTEKDLETRQNFLNTVTRGTDGRYSVSLPWVDGVQRIPSNKTMAEKRLITTTRKLQGENKYAEYDKIFKLWENEGIIEVVDESEHDHPSYYLPHRAVFKPESITTPIRPVFDASCKTLRTPSLNQCLEKGPNLLELIPSILLQFREKKIGITADIRKAFQMIEIKKEDRDFLRFLWWEDPAGTKLKVYRHGRVVFGLNCSPFLLGAVIEFHLDQVAEEKITAEKLRKALYVDNCVLSVDSVEECVNFKESATAILAEAQMELRLWECGSSVISGVGQLSSNWCGLDSGHNTHVLGLIWDKELDTLRCNVTLEDLPEIISKRTILSFTQRIFDPIGFTCPTTIVPKIFLQELWKANIGWDEEVPGEVRNKFVNWFRELSNLTEIKIPRNATAGVKCRENWQIHTFCDASQGAYAAAVFIRTERDSGIEVQLLQGKARVAPIKKISIPRLELIACTIAARLTVSIQSSLVLTDVPVYLWSDSSTALAWIRRNDNWGTFVGNRVKEICKLTSANNWRHVPGVVNPADLPSRGCSPEDLRKSRWWEGPKWLKLSQEHWPNEVGEVDEGAVESEKKKSATVNLVNSEANPWYVQRSTFHKNVVTVAWVKRFADRIIRKDTSTGPISVNELNSAENTLLKLVQGDSLPVDEAVISGVRVVTGEDALVRVKTKLIYRDDTVGFRYPILLPNTHAIVDQLIRKEHFEHKHAGVQFLMGTLREKYWIIQGRRTIRRVLDKCVVCRRYTAKKSEVVPAPLPQDRVKDAKVFEVTGIDLAGPLFLKDQSKTWVVLFTCAVFRPVHLELVTSMSTEGFLLALRRFIARRGRPAIIYCDNGTNFVGSNSALKNLDWKKILADSEIKRIQWKFNPPVAPWWGGWWERLVCSMKDLLKRSLGRSSLNYEELMTCLCDAEAVLNGRPLTYVTEDPDDLIPLTPAMFMQDMIDVAVDDLDVLDSTGFQRRFRYRQKLREELRSRFRKEYLAQLVQHGKETKLRKFKVGDIVLVGSDKKRIEWPMARILELLPGKDGHIRVAKVKTAMGTLLRPIQRLYSLEVSSADNLPISRDVKEIAVAESSKNKEEVKVTHVKVKPDIRTKSGRKVVTPNRFGYE